MTKKDEETLQQIILALITSIKAVNTQLKIIDARLQDLESVNEPTTLPTVFH